MPTDGFTTSERDLDAKSFILPGALFTYGVLSLNVPVLKNVNHDIHDHVAISSRKFPVQLESYLQWTPVVGLYALNAFGIHGHHDFIDRSGIYAIALIVQASLSYELKKIAKETRPNGEGTQSFPSGHTSNAFAAAEVLRREYSGINPWYGAAGYAMALATAYLRMVHNKHWFGDVVGGAAVGIFSADLAYLVYPSVKRLLSSHHSAATLAFPFWQQGAIGMSVVHFF